MQMLIVSPCSSEMTRAVGQFTLYLFGAKEEAVAVGERRFAINQGSAQALPPVSSGISNLHKFGLFPKTR